MAAQATIPPEQDPRPPASNHGGWWQQHGTTAAWVAIGITALIGLANLGSTWYFRHVDAETKSSDEHISKVVEEKFKPLNRDIFEDKMGKFGDKIDKLTDKVQGLSERVARLEGPLTKRVSDLEKNSKQQASLAKLMDPSRVLATIRAEIQMAENNKKPLTTSTLADYKNAIQMFPTTPEYWPAAAQFISYRSQTSVQDYQDLTRPDLPNCVDKPPIPMKIIMDAEAEMARKDDVVANSKGTHFTPALYENCRFTLDSPIEKSRIPELQEGRSYILTFRRCQIVYHGGPITLLTPNPRLTAITGYGPTRSDVFVVYAQTITFENCLFLFDIKDKPVSDGQSLTRQLLSQNGPIFTIRFPNSSTHS